MKIKCQKVWCIDEVDGGVNGLQTFRCGLEVRWTPLKFIGEAKRLTNPYDRENRLPKEVAKIVLECAGFESQGIDFLSKRIRAHYRERVIALEAPLGHTAGKEHSLRNQKEKSTHQEQS